MFELYSEQEDEEEPFAPEEVKPLIPDEEADEFDDI